MGAEQSQMLGYSTVDMDVTEDERKQALSALVLKAEELMRGQSIEVPASLLCEPSPKKPLQDVGNRLPASHLTGQKAAQKLPISSLATSCTDPGHQNTATGDCMPPLLDASFSACQEEQAMVPDAIKAAMSQSIVASGDDGQNAETGTSANQFSPAKVPEDRMGAQQALFKAVATRDGAMLRHLLRHENASLDEQSHEGQTPLHVAAAQGFGDMVSILAILGANLDARTRDIGNTPLHLAAAAGSLKDPGRKEVLDVLLGLGASADLPNKEGRSPMHVAAMTGNIAALDKLLAAGARRGCLDKDNMRPVDLEIACGATDAVEYLNALDAKAQANKIRQYQQWLA